ncbi:MAG: phosphoglycerate mutase family protein [Polyangiales bacterium]
MSDGERWLTAHGRRTTREVAAALLPEHHPYELWTSPLVRATQTAEIIAAVLELDDRIRVLRALATGDVAAVLAAVREYPGPGPLMLVGHEPTLSSLTRQLLGPSVRWLGYDKSAACALTLTPEGARFDGLLTPDLHRVSRLPT